MDAHYMLVASALHTPITGAHFHRGSPRVNGDSLLLDITSDVLDDSAASGYWTSSSTFPFSPTIATYLRNGRIFVDFHSDTLPDGEARGNVVSGSSFTGEPPVDPMFNGRVVLAARLTGAQETPPVSTAAVGLAGFMLNARRDTLFVTVSANGLSGPITGMHVHEGDSGVAGSIVTGLTQFVSGNGATAFITGPDLTRDILAKYLAGKYYINIHTAANPNGEIRGQILLQRVRLSG